MGLIIKGTKENPIVIAGTEIEMPEIYGRVEFAGRADGKTMEISLSTFASGKAYEGKASVITTNVPNGNVTVELKDGEQQTAEMALEYGKFALEQAGFEVGIEKI